ncbi:MAG: LamG-like jellyroll fold domain-containing protein [Pseudomonadota bacterium]
MARVEWARASQFNWAFDNMGGTPLQEAVAGNWQNAAAQVQADGRVSISTPNPGGGQVYFLRGVWHRDTAFPWAGFWADPMGGDLTNYYLGGSFANQGSETMVTLGSALPPGTPVQLYYIYLTGEQAAKYESLNNYPCIRRAHRARDDYTYDFAVDRILDLMVFLHFAGLERGRDYGPLIRFLWDAFQGREESRTPPLMHDSFERQWWDRGPHLIYRGATSGEEAFEVFQSDPAPEAAGRALHVRAELPTTQDAAWFGYGLDWSLEAPPFNAVNRVSFRLQGPGGTLRVHNLTKVGSGSAVLVLTGDYSRQEKRRFVVEMETTGEIGAATFRWSRDGGLTWEAGGLVSGDRDHPVALSDGLQVYWESGQGTDLVAGDHWTFWGGEPAAHPRRLLVTLNDSAPDAADPWGPEHTYVHALPDRFPEAVAFQVPFSQFWRRDNLIEDCDRATAMWGAWYSTSQQDSSDITIGLREETEVLLGDTYYTQRHITWDLSPYVTAFGVWAGIDTGRCNSSGRTNLNFLIKPVVPGVSTLTLRVKVKDAQGSYFFQEVTVQGDAWQRVVLDLADLQLESGSPPLTHPIQVVDLGIPSAPPSNGAFYLTDLKFDEHQTFAGAQRLRLLEFKMEQQGLPDHEWWLDEVSLNLEAQDPYPYAPRLAISLTPYGQNPWRGPTPVHYAQPLAPHLVGALTLAQNYLSLHRDAQEEFHRRYGGVKGAIVPVHTRNDVENVALCGEEDFCRFSWWRRHRDFGKVLGFWHCNGALGDASGAGHTLTFQGGGSPLYVSGVCQPGATAVDLDGSHYLTQDSPDFNVGTGDFTIEVVLKPAELVSGARIISKMAGGGPGYEVLLGDSGAVQACVADSSGSSLLSPTPALALDTAAYHYLAVAFDRDGQFTFCVDGDLGYCAAARPGSLDNSQNFTVGRAAEAAQNFLKGRVDLLRVHRRALNGEELQDNWRIIQGQVNGSAYPEVGSALGQFWAFQRLAEYFYVTREAGAWEVLENWLAWIDAYGAPDGSGWKFPACFSEFGFTYGAYDPGAAAALALGCLQIYLRNGNDTAATWARRLLDDLRENRWDPDYGGYQSDYHHSWLNALALRVFGLAVNGGPGQSYRFVATAQDRDHFDTLASWILAHAGDEKPNVLNADLIPFSYSEDADMWDYAPHYLAMSQMGTLEGVVLMLGGALEYARARGDWVWWQRLLDFIVLDNLVVLAASQLRAVTTAYDQAGLKNLVRVRYADYDRDNSKYAEARDETAVSAWGQQALDLDCRYGGPVALEDPDMAQILASRLLQRLTSPWEAAEVETWLEGGRVELGDAVAVSSEFHGLDQAEFTVFGKDLDLGRRSVRLSLRRPLDLTCSWAVDAAGSPYESWAIDQASSYDGNWDFRAYAG